MKRITALVLAAAILLVAASAFAQAFKQRKDGNYEMTMPDGTKMVMGKDGRPVTDSPESQPAKKTSGSLELGAKSDKKSRTKAGPASCTANRDLLVEHKIITGHEVAISMTGSCDGDVFNTQVKASQTGINVSGSGELRLTDSEVSADQVAVNVSGSGDAILEGVTLVGPTAINVSGTGNVMVKNSRIYGKISVTGTAKLIDEGGNTLVADHTKAPAAKPAKSSKKGKKGKK